MQYILRLCYMALVFVLIAAAYPATVQAQPVTAQANPAPKMHVDDNAPNSDEFFQIEPLPAADDQSDADLPPPLPLVTQSWGYGFNGKVVSFDAAQWQAQIYSTSPLSAYTPAERAGDQIGKCRIVATAR